MSEDMSISVTEGRDVHLPVSKDSRPPRGKRFGQAHHVLLLFCGLALVVWLLSGIYMVNANEVAVIERLGKYQMVGNTHTIRKVEQGLHYRLPWPIDRVYKIPILKSNQLMVTTFDESPDAYRDFKLYLQRTYAASPELLSALFDPYLITGDKDVVHLKIAVTYRLDDPDAWLNTVAHDDNVTPGVPGAREELFQDLVQHAMVREIATIPIDRILFEGRDKLPPLLNQAITAQLDLPDPRDPTQKRRTNLGIRIDKVDVVAASPPKMVQPAFNKVFEARSNMEAARIAGEQAAQSAVIEAEASKQTQIQQAEAYRSMTINAATGEANRFAQIYQQYKVAPDITRWNVYVDAVQAVSHDAVRIMFAQPGQQVWLPVEALKFDASKVNPQQ